MPIKILIDPMGDAIPKDAIRVDLAWNLFLPNNSGDLPELGKGGIEKFRHWLWNELSGKLGFLHKGFEKDAVLAAPTLTGAGKEFLLRTCSFWSNGVYIISPNGGDLDLNNIGENLWIPPIVNVDGEHTADSTIGRLTETEGMASHTFYAPLLGATKSFMRTYAISEGGTYSRFHSHTAREEIYLVLEGAGTARIGNHHVQIKKGDFISKPTGPDLPTQFLADRGESLKIMDIEIWPEDERKSKDLVHYPDHEELDLFGEGWNLMIPSEAIMSFEDAMDNYDSGYKRNIDGTWEPKDIPGFKKREK